MVKRTLKKLGITTSHELPDVMLEYDAGDPTAWWESNRKGYVRAEISFPQTNYQDNIVIEFDPKAKKLRDEEIITQMHQAMQRLRLSAKRQLTPEHITDLEQQVIESIGALTDRLELPEQYIKQKRRDEELHQSQREKELLEKERKISDSLRTGVLTLEAKAIYRIATEVSKPLEYNLTREAVERRVKSLFEKDDNLLYRPIFRPAKEGEWAKFTRELLGDGFYFKLKNVEDDLDDFYITALQEVQKTTIGKKLSDKELEEAYHEAIRTKFGLENILDLLGRERDVNIDLLNRFQAKLDGREVNYTEALNGVRKKLEFTGGLFTVITGGIAAFTVAHAVVTSTAEFNEQLKSLESELGKYFRKYEEKLRLASNETPQNHDYIEVIKIAHNQNEAHALAGSYGKKTGQHQVDYSLITGKPVQGAYRLHENLSQLRKVKSIAEAHGNPEAAAHEILKKATELSLDTATNKGLIKLKEQIRGYHPYLQDQVEFIQGFYTGMKARFEKIYTPSKVE